MPDEENTSRKTGRPSKAEANIVPREAPEVTPEAPQVDTAALMEQMVALQAKIAEMEAREKATSVVNTSVVKSELDLSPSNSDNILIHFINDGVTAFGKIWYRGEEIEIDPNSQQYLDTCGSDGKSWLDMRDKPWQQEAVWGEEKFRNGPWPGKRFSDLSSDDESVISAAELEAAARAERNRRRQVSPLPPMGLS